MPALAQCETCFQGVLARDVAMQLAKEFSRDSVLLDTMGGQLLYTEGSHCTGSTDDEAQDCTNQLCLVRLYRQIINKLEPANDILLAL